VLYVDPISLNIYGAVSETVVLEMALGALQKSGADYVIAVTGIAGPDGGSEEKPVGTVWIAWGSRSQLKTRRLFYPSERRMFQTIVAAYGLDLIRRELSGITETPRYFR
jgi:nicotinamide-nucleotide amidase